MAFFDLEVERAHAFQGFQQVSMCLAFLVDPGACKVMQAFFLLNFFAKGNEGRVESIGLGVIAFLFFLPGEQGRAVSREEQGTACGIQPFAIVGEVLQLSFEKGLPLKKGLAFLLQSRAKLE